MQLKTLLLGCGVLFISALCHGQCPYFDYDNNGNRVKRYDATCKRGFESTNPAGETKPAISVYPNPSSKQVTIHCDSAAFKEEVAYISVLTTDGRMVEQFVLKRASNSLSLDVTNYPSGVYLFRSDQIKLESRTQSSFVVLH